MRQGMRLMRDDGLEKVRHESSASSVPAWDEDGQRWAPLLLLIARCSVAVIVFGVAERAQAGQQFGQQERVFAQDVEVLAHERREPGDVGV